MFQNKIIEEFNSPYAFNVIVIEKKDRVEKRIDR